MEEVPKGGSTCVTFWVGPGRVRGMHVIPWGMPAKRQVGEGMLVTKVGGPYSDIDSSFLLRMTNEKRALFSVHFVLFCFV